MSQSLLTFLFLVYSMQGVDISILTISLLVEAPSTLSSVKIVDIQEVSHAFILRTLYLTSRHCALIVTSSDKVLGIIRKATLLIH